MLPGTDGLDVLRAARAQGVRTPVIVLTARGLMPDKIQAFEAGADDYLVKPFAMDELLARIEAVHRRTADKPAMTLSAGGLQLSLSNKRVTLHERTVDLTPTEFSILELLMRHHGQVVTRKMLCEHVWGFDWVGPDERHRGAHQPPPRQGGQGPRDIDDPDHPGPRLCTRD